MNTVSDVNLAIACYNAGILPSLVQYRYLKDGVLNYELLENALKEYATATNYGGVMLASDLETIKNPKFFDLIIKYRVTFIELLDYTRDTIVEMYNEIAKYKKENVTITPKELNGYETVQRIHNSLGPLDCITIKGPKGAGRGVETIVLEDQIVKIKSKFPSMTLIVSGGINTGDDIKRMLELGADCVAMGTIFCASEESSMNIVAKNKIIEASYTDVVRLETGAKQNALVFGKVQEWLGDENNTAGLLTGVHRGTSGHVYVGTGIDHVQKIESVKDIVDRLTMNL
jgi:NAD(P)H-dependent flavin oxidoreductase YrpB (nitropropane dioxygenase family)